MTLFRRWARIWLGIMLAISGIGCGEQPRPMPPILAKKASTPEKSTPGPPLKQVLSTRDRPSGTIPRFRMHGTESGFDFERQDDIRGQHRILEANGGGIAVFDFDRDGLLDVLMTNGCRLPLKEQDRSTPSQLFQNRGDFRFAHVTNPSRLMQYGYSTGCAVGDVDGDGFDDLYIAALGPDAYWHNNGDGTFSDLTAQSGISCPQWGSSAAFADLNGDGHLDLYVVNYLQESDEHPKLCPNPASPDKLEQCPPAMFEGAADVLYLSDGAGRFVDCTTEAGLQNSLGKGLGVVVCDFNRDGQQEIYVANDGEANFLFVREPAVNDKTSGNKATSRASGGSETARSFPAVKYTERALDSGCALSESGYAQAGMGVTVGDYDSNGTQDIFLTHFFNDTSTLYANRGDLSFEDATRSTILGPASRTKLGFGTVFCDFDNDGWLDLIVANGHIDDRTWMKQGEPYRMQAQLFRNDRHANFVETSAWGGPYFSKSWLGRGLAVGDLNRDGKMDAVVSHQLAPSTILENETATEGGSLVLHLVGTRSNRNGYHARIEVVGQTSTVMRELTGGGSFQAGSAPEIHIGTDNTTPTTIRISWPSGTVETYPNLTSGHWLVLEGGKMWPFYD